jgi:hypothetical protein
VTAPIFHRVQVNIGRCRGHRPDLAALTCAALVSRLAACGGDGCDAGPAAGDVCPGPTYGYARVEGTLHQLDGTPAVNRQVFVSCGDVIGGYGDHTDGAGRFSVQPVYSNADTILFPHPPRDVAGNFLVHCGVGGELRYNVFVRDSALVPFAPTRAAVSAVQVSLVESAVTERR